MSFFEGLEMKTPTNAPQGLYRATRFHLYAKVANQDVAFGVREISVESLGLAVNGRLTVGMQFSVYLFHGEVPVASNLRVQVMHYEKGYARCAYVDLTRGQAQSLQRIVTRRYVAGAPMPRRRMYS